MRRPSAEKRPSTLISFRALCLLWTILTVTAAPWARATEGTSRVAVVVGREAPALEQYAAEQLCSYLNMLFDISTQPTHAIPRSAEVLILIGNPGTNATVKQAAARLPFPKLSDQGIAILPIRFQNRPTLIVGGGSPRATLWAVYELLERWGVRYLLHGDVLPPKRSEFRLPDARIVLEPALRVRQWRVLNDFANGPESWGMADYRPVLDQLAKMKFTRIHVSIWPWQPFLDYEIRGIKRRSAWLWYDYHYPITPDMVGRSLFGSEKEFWNPDLPFNAGYDALTAAGVRLVHNLIAYAHERGMEAAITATLTEFPPEFAPLLKTSIKVHQLGELDIVPGPQTDVDDPVLAEMATAILRATVTTYPEADYLAISNPEFRQWTGQYERAWRGLDSKYSLGGAGKLDDMLKAAARRVDYPGGPARAVDEVKGDIAMEYFCDRLLTDLKALKGTRRPDMKFIYGEVAEELYPILSRILPPGSETANAVDYTPSRVVKRQEVLKNLRSDKIPAVLIYTLEDDNIGVVPQLTTGSLHTLTRALELDGWSGFATRYWVVGGQDPAVAYLARAAWDREATPDGVDGDQLRAVCGEGCVDDMLKAFHAVEAVTINLEWNDLGFAFPVPGMMMKHWKPKPMPAHLIEARQGYENALKLVQQAQANSTPQGRDYLDYWAGRLTFALGYLDAVAAVHRAASSEAANNSAETLKNAREAQEHTRRSARKIAASPPCS